MQISIVPKLCDPAPYSKVSSEYPNPRLLGMHEQDRKIQHERQLSDYRRPFSHHVLEFLTMKEVMFISRLSKGTHQMIYDDSRFWKSRFNKLCLGPFIYVPELDEISHIQRWVKVLFEQQKLVKHKIQLDNDLVIANRLANPDQDAIKVALIGKFRSRKHQCGLCVTDVDYALHLNNNPQTATVAAVVQMACPDCYNSKLWDAKQASILWDVPTTRMKDVSCWRLPDKFWYSTPDLTDNFIKFHAQLLKPPVFKSQAIVDNFKNLLTHLKNSSGLQDDILKKFENLIEEYEGLNAIRERYVNTQQVQVITDEMASRSKDLPPIVRAVVNCEHGEIPQEELEDIFALSQENPAAPAPMLMEGERKSIQDSPKIDGLVPSLEQGLLPKKQIGYFITYKKKAYPPPEFQETERSMEAKRLQEKIQKNAEADADLIERITSPLSNSKDEVVTQLLDTIHADMLAAGEPGLRSYADARQKQKAQVPTVAELEREGLSNPLSEESDLCKPSLSLVNKFN